jgi:uncharacterized repeat protein (TIGR03803 family)
MRPSRLLVVMFISLAVAATCAAQTPSFAPTATFTTITDFGEGNGQYPTALAQGLDGNLYGATRYGNRDQNGDAYYMTTSGAFTLLSYSCNTNYCTGSKPYAGLTLAGDGNFYSTTSYGGDGQYRTLNQAGTIYRANPQTGLTTMYSFCSRLGCQDGDDPYTPLTLGSDGNLYGTTILGGLHKHGTAFVITLAGKFNTIHQFCAQTNCTDGSYPSALIQATDGNFYGVAGGGTGAYCATANTCGVVFKMTPKGVTTTLYNFCSVSNCTDGFSPQAIIQGADGNFYGTTAWRGTATGPGTIFKLSLQGQLTTLYTLCGSTCTSGSTAGGMIQATDGSFYGFAGGSTATIFEFTSSGQYSTLYTFPNGYGPQGIIQATDGNFYGSTLWGGTTNYGTAFKPSTGLAPFIQTVTSSGKAGSSVIILGNNLTGATSVTFNGVAATSFKVVTDTYMTAVVPSGATTGKVVVTTPGGALTSNVNFRIIN